MKGNTHSGKNKSVATIIRQMRHKTHDNRRTTILRRSLIIGSLFWIL
ncbi:hypothetical protein LEP1GSC187_3068 [Leptospira santarosai str. ZUN179]|uniref:Uncharacterized protein n=1 Tax=Leptospira santarosai str. ZUN179 TaxID=1049985 RepID=M6ULU8_9LEPT|nr:hypothetical protein LEP1GSC187_3068 [Leptospira santarosai str. ZUN179]